MITAASGDELHFTYAGGGQVVESTVEMQVDGWIAYDASDGSGR